MSRLHDLASGMTLILASGFTRSRVDKKMSDPKTLEDKSTCSWFQLHFSHIYYRTKVINCFPNQVKAYNIAWPMRQPLIPYTKINPCLPRAPGFYMYFVFHWSIVASHWPFITALHAEMPNMQSEMITNRWRTGMAQKHPENMASLTGELFFRPRSINIMSKLKVLRYFPFTEYRTCVAAFLFFIPNSWRSSIQPSDLSCSFWVLTVFFTLFLQAQYFKSLSIWWNGRSIT